MILINNIVEQLTLLRESLLFLNMAELRQLCIKKNLPSQGNKIILIIRIIHFIKTGQVIKDTKIPDISKAKRGIDYPLDSNTLMLKGAYKNDLKNRLFFKMLIGDYFHFTAFGIDWLNERWINGMPPTYEEFAIMWKAEYAKRKEMPAAPKEEWAYINFTQNFIKSNPNASRALIMQSWQNERTKKLSLVNELIGD